MNKVVVIGTGNVGMSYAYALLNQKTSVDELFLVDINRKDAEGEALDLHDALGFSPSTFKIRAGSYADCKDAKMVVITAGARQAEGETRMDLLVKNTAMVKDMVSQIMRAGFNGIFLVVTNPMDVMTYLVWQYSGLPHSQVIGSGTVLDSSRLMYAVAHKIKVSPRDIHAYVVGEHGDSEFVPWSVGTVGLESISMFLGTDTMRDIEHRVRNQAYEIIKRKGATHYGIGVCMARITRAILNNERAILPVSNYDPYSRIYFGWPAIVERNGVKRRVALRLMAGEQKKLEKSVATIKEAIKEARAAEKSTGGTSGKA
ncbi:L-lactate dehydrogenase [Candidatus Saccharibacteria bacterium]|nr:L-lactate dehydrogenase [Candidatus Saccharibacteria bacterium]